MFQPKTLINIGKVKLLDDTIKKLDLDFLDQEVGLIKIVEFLKKFNILIVRPSYVLVGGIMLLLLLTLSKFFINLSIFIVAFLVPAHKSFSLLLKHDNEEKTSKILKFWFIFALFLVFDVQTSFWLNILPFYPYSKIGLYYSLSASEFKFSNLIYDKISDKLKSYFTNVKQIPSYKNPAPNSNAAAQPKNPYTTYQPQIELQRINQLNQNSYASGQQTQQAYPNLLPSYDDPQKYQRTQQQIGNQEQLAKKLYDEYLRNEKKYQ